MRAQCRRELLLLSALRGDALFLLACFAFHRGILDACPLTLMLVALVYEAHEPILRLEALIFMVLVADFTASPGQVDYDAPAGVSFTTTTQNVLEIAAAAVVSLYPVVIIVVATAAAAAAAAAA